MNLDSDPLVTVPLREIRRIRDALARVRDVTNLTREVWRQVASLVIELEKQAATSAACEAAATSAAGEGNPPQQAKETLR